MADLRSILVVDDDKAMRDMVVSLLREAGFDVVTAMGADDAILELRGGCVRAVLSDIQMRGKSGFEFLRAVRGLAPGVPVILMTSFGNVVTLDRAKREGAFDCLSKPFSREELIDSLTRALVAHPAGRSEPAGPWRAP